MSDQPTATETSTGPKPYRIGDKTYRQEPLSWTQEKWLAEHVFNGVDVSWISQVDLLMLLKEKATLLLGIVLIEEGSSRTAKGQAGFAAAQALAIDIANELTPEAIREMAQDFFTVNPIQNLWLLVDFGRLAPAADVAAEPSGSTPVSVSLPAGILPSGIGSSSMPDRETVSSMPVGSSNGS